VGEDIDVGNDKEGRCLQFGTIKSQLLGSFDFYILQLV